MRYRIVILMCFLVALSVSCQQEEISDGNIVKGPYSYVFKGINISLTKVEVGDKDGDVWPMTWEYGDKVAVYDSSDELIGVAVLDEDSVGKNQGTFTMDSDVLISEGESLNFMYPYVSGSNYDDGTFKGNIRTSQKQADATSSHNVGSSAFAYASALYNGAGTEFELEYANAYMKFSIIPGEYAGYTLCGMTVWCKGTELSGFVSIEKDAADMSVTDSDDYVETRLDNPVEMEEGGEYELWVSAFPSDFTDKKLYAIIHMEKDGQTVTLPVRLNGAKSLPSHSVTHIAVPELKKSYAPRWYETVEDRYIAADGQGWAYGPENTVLFTENNAAKMVDFKARGNFMKVAEPKYIKVYYASNMNADNKTGVIFIDGDDCCSSGVYQEFELSEDYSASIAMKNHYSINSKAAGHIGGLLVLDADKNVIWGTNLWLALNAFSTAEYKNGTVLDCNIGSDSNAKNIHHWTVCGTYFQWGRPWAFPWTTAITKDMAAVDATWTLEKSASHPYTLIYHTGDPYDWYYGDGSKDEHQDDLNDLWGNPNNSTSGTVLSSGVKSIYDPCPEGYMVVSPAVISEVESNIQLITDAEPNYLLHNGIAWSLSGAFLGTVNSNGNLERAGSSNNKTYIAAYWSNSNDGYRGRSLSYQPSASSPLLTNRNRTMALPVRCMVEVENVGGSGSSGGSSGGSTGGEIDDDYEIPGIPDDFTEEANDPSSTPSGTFNYSVLQAAGHPRLLADAEGWNDLREKVTVGKTQNPTLYKLHSEVLRRADKIVDSGRQVATISDKDAMVDNLLSCAYAYKITGKSKYLDKVREDMNVVCGLTDWEPSGLPIGEISLAMGLAYDWLYYDLTLEERVTAHEAMVSKGIEPMSRNTSLASAIGNWNQINFGGVSVAALAVYEKDKNIAVTLLEKALAGNLAGVTGLYKPNGNYGEGLGYWEYGGGFQACFLSSLEGIFGSTAGIAEVPGFMESGKYSLFMHGTMDTCFSYSDGGGGNDPILLTSWWFAAQNNDPDLLYCEKRRVEKGDYTNTDLSDFTYRLLAPMVVMLRDFDMDSKTPEPPAETLWNGDGEMPVVMVRRGWEFDDTDVYLGIKGGCADSWETSGTSHAHMDMGSFVFEAEGIRWSDDIMRPNYGSWFAAMTEAGSRSGDTSQTGLRWDTFHVSNLCHSTLVSYTNDGSVPGKLHSTDYFVDGFAYMEKIINTAGRQGAVVNMTAPMKGQVQRAKRTVELVNGTDLVVTDYVIALPESDCVLEWRMLSMADSEVVDGGVKLHKMGKTRIMSVTSSEATVVPVYSTWTTEKPVTDGWGVLDFHQSISNRTIVGWKATVPKGDIVTFTTTLKRE